MEGRGEGGEWEVRFTIRIYDDCRVPVQCGRPVQH